MGVKKYIKEKVEEIQGLKISELELHNLKLRKQLLDRIEIENIIHQNEYLSLVNQILIAHNLDIKENWKISLETGQIIKDQYVPTDNKSN